MVGEAAHETARWADSRMMRHGVDVSERATMAGSDQTRAGQEDMATTRSRAVPTRPPARAVQALRHARSTAVPVQSSRHLSGAASRPASGETPEPLSPARRLLSRRAFLEQAVSRRRAASSDR